MTTAAVVLAAGNGTRMHSAKGKMLHEVLGEPVVFYPVRAALAAGAAPVVVVVGARMDAVCDLLRQQFDETQVRFCIQDPPRGTADAVRRAESATAGFDRVAVLNGDAVAVTPNTLHALTAAFEQSNAVLAIVTAEMDPTTPYGRIVRDDAGTIARIVEAKDASPQERSIGEMNVGLYLADRTFLFETLQQVEDRNRQREFYLTDIVALAARRGPVAWQRLGDAGEALGINDRRDLAEVEQTLSQRYLRQWQATVTFHQPHTTTIGPLVQLGQDTEVGSGVTLLGKTRVGQRCQIGPGVVLQDSVLDDEVTIGANAVIGAVHVFAGMQVPPLTVLTREGTNP